MSMSVLGRSSRLSVTPAMFLSVTGCLLEARMWTPYRRLMSHQESFLFVHAAMVLCSPSPPAMLPFSFRSSCLFFSVLPFSFSASQTPNVTPCHAAGSPVLSSLLLLPCLKRDTVDILCCHDRYRLHEAVFPTYAGRRLLGMLRKSHEGEECV